MENTDTAAMAATGASDEDEPKRMAIICWSNDLDRVWPVMILATTGAASGLEVDVFFTFWGLRVLQKNDKPVTGKNWMQKAESLFDRGGSEHLKLSKVHFAGAGTSMIKLLAKQHKVSRSSENPALAKPAFWRASNHSTSQFAGRTEWRFQSCAQPYRAGQP